jgi:uncharacterized protein (TIGR03067 family)
MNLLYVVALTAGLLVPRGKEDPVKEDLKNLEGTWVVVEAGGSAVAAARIRQMQIAYTFQGRTMTMEPRRLGTEGTDAPVRERVMVKEKGPVADKPSGRATDRRLVGTITVDPSKTPKQIDLATHSGGQPRVTLGIYQLEGDTLKLCLAPTTARRRVVTDGGKEELVVTGGKRPTAFDPKQGTVLVLKRQKR